ncbi:DJ-1/PfpI family protein [Actinomadura sp. ATCC 31491]|uniref:DJ-1/PfpI family protein n=1 Tax=Actinomadura luzonensis TaxID=2805427 RepID=A0ABT0FTT4_9ACTN|nr:DJ-1/PfpI family protein [Actinomadura luzonensis]MCK2215722.1 DJ-1/PfpI family protein [Actinomadura luzonensis]
MNESLRQIGRFLWHYAEMAVAMLLGMALLGPLWSAALPDAVARLDVRTLTMAADMAAGMAVWMRVRRHGWPAIAEMAAAMVAPFLVLLVPYWLGVLPGAVVSGAGHALMFVLMAVVMLRRRAEYTGHPVRVRVPARVVKVAALVLATLLVPGAVSAVSTVGRFRDLYTVRADAPAVPPSTRSSSYDPARPTVALLLGGRGTNVADLLGPFEVLESTGAVNAYLVAAGPGLAPLTGGLDVVPDLTFDELDRLLAGHGDRLDAVVIPAVQPPEPAESARIVSWLRRQSAAGAVTVSVCNGARMLATTGLLDGRPATSHWWRLGGLRKDFPQVGWTAGHRYVDDGNVLTTAGVLSGVDGALRLVERLAGEDAARLAATRAHWRHYSPGVPAPLPEHALEPRDVVVALNSSYQTGPARLGVPLVDGVGELELASVFVSYTEESMTSRTVALGDGPVRSRHGLTFVPRATLAAAAGGLDRLLVPGADAARRHVLGTAPSPATGGLRPEYLHAREGFPFDAVMLDVAATYDLQTARWTAKTLEYPLSDVRVTGSAWPWGPTLLLAGLAGLGLGAALAARAPARRLRAARRRAPAAAGTGREQPPAELTQR